MIHYSIFDRFRPALEAFSTERNDFVDCSSSKGDGKARGSYDFMNVCSYSGDSISHIKENRAHLSKYLGLSSDELLIFPTQTHGCVVKCINDDFLSLNNDERRLGLMGVDAMVTSLRGVALGINTADCIPVLLYSSDKHVIGIAHAGWKGTLSQIAVKTLDVMLRDYNCSVENIYVAIGVGISGVNYEVGGELYELFSSKFSNADLFFHGVGCGKFLLDLPLANKLSLVGAGINAENIEMCGLCTFADPDRFFSARRLGKESGRVASVLLMH